MAAARRAAGHEIKATQRASGQARSLAESMPRLILEARRIDYARAETSLDTSGSSVAQSFAKLQKLVAPWMKS